MALRWLAAHIRMAALHVVPTVPPPEAVPGPQAAGGRVCRLRPFIGPVDIYPIRGIPVCCGFV
jgi:hypothetical protein